MDNTFRKKLYGCSTHNFKNPEINCTEWSVNNETCKTSCSLNLFDSPTLHNCMDCKKRISHSKEVLEEDEKNYKITNLTINSKPQINVKNVSNYLNAESSQLLQGQVPDDVYEKRKQFCMGCEYKVNNINNRSDEIGWCTSCGCGIGTERTKLSIKLKMPALFCPKGKFNSEFGKGFNFKDANNALKGVVSTIKNLIDK